MKNQEKGIEMSIPDQEAKLRGWKGLASRSVSYLILRAI